jgi:hypothetical protein
MEQPKSKRDYSKGLIYKLQHNTINELVYVGATVDFVRRKADHKKSCNDENSKSYNQLKYRTMRENGGWDAFRIVVVKLYPCNSKIELDIEEERYRVELQASLNSIKCHITDEEKKEDKREYDKNYKEANREAIAKNREEKFNCDCGGKFTLQNKSRHEKTKKHQQFLQQQ